MKLHKGKFNKPLYFTVNGKDFPSFCKDAACRLIFREVSGSSHDWLPYGVGVVDYEYHQDNPLMWEISAEDVSSKIEELCNQNPSMSAVLSRLYPDMGVPQINEIWVEPSSGEFDESDIEKAISLFEASAPEIQASLIDSLVQCGVHPIPELSKFHDRYHRLPAGEIAIEKVTVVRHGWMSNTKIYAKSSVKPS